MSRRLLSTTCLILLAACAVEEPSNEAERPPNLILFLVDDMGWMDSPVYGSRYYETPSLERLARTGMVFSDAYSASPICSPTRASLLTAKSPERLGFTMAWGHRPSLPADFPRYAKRMPPDHRLLTPRSETNLPAEEVTLAEALSERGYRTAHLGKWHLGLEPEHGPAAHGFDVAFHGAPDQGPPSYFSPYGFETGTIRDGPEGEYITDRLTDEALRFLEQHRDVPFFLNLWHFGVHGPWGHKLEITERYLGREDPRGEQGNPIMASMLWSVDESLGRLLDKLEELGIAEDTVVLFSSDNGGSAYDHTKDAGVELADLPPESPERLQMEDWLRYAGGRPPTSNAPLREGKGWLYEGGTRVPLVVAWPGRIASGARSSALVSSPDLFPTLLELAGGGAPDGRRDDGFSFAPTLLGAGRETADRPRREAVFAHFPHVLPRRKSTPGRMAGSSVRVGDWKLIRWYDHTEPVELFDLAQDPGEEHNLAGSHPERRLELEARLDRHLEQAGALLPRPNPEYDPGSPGSGG
jgi:arylsulfatase A-like enzyme